MEFKQYSVSKDSTLFEVLEKMDEQMVKLLIVTDENSHYYSLISIGDIQRAILNKTSLNTEITAILRENVVVGYVNDDLQSLKEMVFKERIEFLPIIDHNNKIHDLILLKNLGAKFKTTDILKELSVVIMAGGKGTRLRPITYVIPKPMVPIGEKSILQIIVERFKAYGCNDFHLSVNYKEEMIAQHVKDIDLNVNFSFLREKKPSGTAGSLEYLKGKVQNTFIVSNCDIVIDQDYSEVYKYHKDNNNMLTAVAAMKRFSLPYGVMEVKDNGILTGLKEKPSMDFHVNAGVYFIEPEALDYIPINTFFNITDLMEKLMDDDKRVGVFPVSDGSWLDIGEWPQYQKTQEIFKARGL